MSVDALEHNVDDLAEAVRENRPLRPGTYRVLLGDDSLQFEPIVLNDPIVLGRQLIEAAEAKPVDEHAALAWLASGDFEDIRLDEPFDLRARGAERVLVVRSDRSFRFKIDENDLEWPFACISGAALKRLAALPPNYNLWQEVAGGHDIKIGDKDLIRLDAPGVERFISLIDQTTEGMAGLPEEDRAYLSRAGTGFEVLSQGGQTGVVLSEMPLPPGKFNAEVVDVLFLLPTGYPDAAPDMFYTAPRLTFATNGALPKATNVQHQFANRTWQRWSRHNTSWRAGIDGLRTMVARATTAFAEAR
ncbi:MAG: multiubiquitin domain-containing protein [Pseudomonadota bacterium]